MTNYLISAAFSLGLALWIYGELVHPETDQQRLEAKKLELQRLHEQIQKMESRLC